MLVPHLTRMCHGWHSNVMASSTTIRERQATIVHEVILDALADLLESEDPETITMARVAGHADVSLRTLYRYFPTREDLFGAVGDHVVARLGLPPDINGADDISANFLESSARGAKHPKLIRSMLDTSLGRRARADHRRRRIDGVGNALAQLTSHLDPSEAQSQAGAIIYLASLNAWVTISEECNLSSDDARRGVAWAIDTLVAELRRENTAEQLKTQGETE
jgi:AcrR family transcriptional regulator